MITTRNTFDFVDEAPDIATALLAILVKKLGGSVVLTKEEIAVYNNTDVKTALDFTFDDEAGEFGLIWKEPVRI